MSLIHEFIVDEYNRKYVKMYLLSVNKCVLRCLQVLLLLINLVQNNENNTQRFLNVRIRIDNEDDIISRSISALDLIVDLFYKREDLARFVQVPMKKMITIT